MFVRTINQSNGKVSILIVENIREGDKVRQKKLRQVATVLPAEVERFRAVAEYIKAEMEEERTPWHACPNRVVNAQPANCWKEILVSRSHWKRFIA